MIDKTDLIGKHVAYTDRDEKFRVGKVVRIRGSTLTIQNAVKARYRIHKDRIHGRQLRKRGLEKIRW